MFNRITDRYASELDATMRQIVASQLNDEDGFGVMIRYTMGWVDVTDQPYLHSTGKRLRPTLMLLCNETAGGRWADALLAAAAVELLHNFSLVHDDIQDDSDTRHNRPTAWKIWGVPTAINAGDTMFTLAYAALAALDEARVPSETILTIWRLFNKTNLELTRGQHLDMRFEQQAVVEVGSYLSMISGKSAALLASSAQIGALIATHDAEKAQHYADFGLNIGIAFQIRDDILGIWGDPELTGKSAATDIISRKKSLPVLYGLRESDELNSLYQNDRLSPQQVTQAVRILDDIGAQEKTRQLELSYYDRAMEALASAQPTGEAEPLLRDFVSFLFRRDY